METDATAAVMVSIADIRTDGDTQVRQALDAATVDRYAELMAEGAKFPPVIVYRDAEGNLWLADGFHRREARVRSGETEILAEVWVGTRREAILKAIESNAGHGLVYSREDQRRAVELLLRDEEWSQWSDRAIARQVGVSNSWVSKLRKAVSVLGEQIRDKVTPATKRVTRGGTTYEMDTANIGKREELIAEGHDKTPRERAVPVAFVRDPGGGEPLQIQTDGVDPVRTWEHREDGAHVFASDEHRDIVPPEGRVYDVEMINDFLGHLFVELRVAIDECEGKTDPEWQAELGKCLQKYRVPLLFSRIPHSSDEAAEEEHKRAGEIHRTKRLAACKEQLDRLGQFWIGLLPLFRESLRTVQFYEAAGRWPVLLLDPNRVLGEEDPEESPDPVPEPSRQQRRAEARRRTKAGTD